MAIDFLAWPKISRLNRDMIVTEKIDGTNAAVIIESHGVHPGESVAEYIGEQDQTYSTFRTRLAVLNEGTDQAIEWPGMYEVFEIGAQSRKRLIAPQDDNFGFASWVWANADSLLDALGEGRHFGEWWGSGIQRGYGLPKGEKCFSLFNVSRYREIRFSEFGLDNVGIVPVLYEGPFSQKIIDGLVEELRRDGSFVGSLALTERFPRPEGVVVFHVHGNHLYKVTCEADSVPKTVAERLEKASVTA